MRTHLMIALLASNVIAASAILPTSAEAQNRMGRQIATAKPGISRASAGRPAMRPAARPGTRPAARPSIRDNAGGSLGGVNSRRPNWENRPNRPGNQPNYGGNRPGRPNGGRGPDNVVIVNGRPGGGYYDQGRYYDQRRYHDDDDNDFLEFVGKTAAVTAGVSLVSAVIGSVVKDKPSEDCQQQIQNGQVYLLCDGVWYTPATVTGQSGYEVVAPPPPVAPAK